MERNTSSIKERKVQNGGNPAKGSRNGRSTDRAKSTGSKNTRNNRKATVKKANTPMQKKTGMVLAILLLLTTVVFLYSIFKLNMLPLEYNVIIMSVLAVIWIILAANQLFARKRATFGKFICVLLTICLGTGSFYLIKTNNMLASITNTSGLRIDEMAVVVLVEDAAETIEDAANYSYGVQYMLNGDHVDETVEHINEVLEAEIETVEFESIAEQANALLKGEIDALIYNEAYSTIIEEEYPDYPNLVKVIFTHEIETEVEEKVVDKDVTSEPFAIYISGIDVYGSINKSSRSDVNIIMYINPETKQILLVNTPRDYYVTLPGVTGSSKDKLTHAGIYGVSTSLATLENVYDTEIEYYARVNFTSLITMVDALGGISVYSDQSFTTMHGGYSIVKGMNTLSGAQALGFSRERYALSGGDNDRGKNQQAVITAMIQKATSPAIITGASKILSSVSGNVDTDFPQSDIQALIKSQISDGGSWNIKSMAASGTGDSQYCYSYSGSKLYVMQPNVSSVNKIKTVIESLRNGEVLTDEMIAQ